MDEGTVGGGDFGVATGALPPALAPLLRSAILTLLCSGYDICSDIVKYT
jgi:hypothetical protein